MKKKLRLLMVMLMVCIGMSAQQLAFPGAQGWGRYATGGRGGSVYHVTNLDDSGTGSLRDAVSQPNRIIVFDVAGVIRINSRIVFSNNLYVAGQTAPGEGVTVYGDGVSFTGASNIIVRHMRFRMGASGSNGKDCAGLANGANMIFDHCSFAWGQDETFSINPDGKGITPQNITLQHCVIGQGLMTHSAGGLMQSNYISLIGNFYCDNATRNNKIKGINQYANNIVYNWKNGAYIMGGDSEGSSQVNIQSNLFINGPAVGGDAFTGGNSDFHAYVIDNWQDRNRNGVFDPSEVTSFSGAAIESAPYDYPELTLNPGRTLLETNLPTVGASLPYRDPVDYYMVDEVMSYGLSGALISNEETLIYGAPSTWKVYAGVARDDTDGDGMPDAWETENGTNPAVNDAMTIGSDGYANIERYINSITVDDRQFFLRVPVGLVLDKATTTTLAISWRDYTYAEDGFAIEVKTGDGEFCEKGRTAANTTSYTISGLEQDTKYVVRIRAFSDDKYSDYTSEVTMMTRPVEVGVVDVDAYEADYVWTSGNFDKSQADASNVLFAPVANGTLTLTESTQPKTVVYNANTNLSLGGASITGATSMNKAGKGTLSLTGSNTYTGATVLHDGVLEFSVLANGGDASSIGSSSSAAQNWNFDGGTYRYIGSSVTTDRSLKISSTSTLDLRAATVTMNGVAEGASASSDFILDGGGQLTVGTANFFQYKGATVLKGSTLYLSSADISKAGIGSSSKLVMAGGHLKTKGESSSYETYAFPIEVEENTVSQFSPNRNCYITNRVSGLGTLQLNIPYLREYVKGDWSAFKGRLIGYCATTGSQNKELKEGGLLLLDSNPKLDSTIVELRGNTRLAYWSTIGSVTLGGLSGESTTWLSGSSKNTANFSCEWHVGTKNSDETFHGRINNWASAGSSYKGTVSIEKVGTGFWRLTGNNDYAGTTKVTAGMLIVDGTNSGTGAYTVANDATLAGEGTIGGSVTVNEGGTVMAGDTVSNEKTLTINGSLTVKKGGIVSILANSRNGNTLLVKGNATLGEDVVLQLAGEVLTKVPYDKVEYKVLDCTGTLTGTFAEIIPAIPGEGQTWDTSELYTKGILRVVGGDPIPDNPEEPIVEPDPEPQSETKKVCIAWGNCTRTGGDNACTQLIGNEATPSNNINYSMKYTTVTGKYYSKGEKMTYEFDGVQRTGIKLSNGAQNSIMLPEGHKVTKLVIWSVVGTNSSNRTSYWKEVAGKTYTEADGQILDLTKTAAAPNKAEFVLDNVQNELTFTNTGEQQSVVLVLEYHTGGSSTGIGNIIDGTPVRQEYYTLSGKRVTVPGKGLYIVRSTTAGGQVMSRKVTF